jgi:hypothetical protein
LAARRNKNVELNAKIRREAKENAKSDRLGPLRLFGFIASHAGLGAPMLSCKEASMLLSQAQERDLGLKERFFLQLHLLLCDGCANFRKQLAFIRTAVRRCRDKDL